MGVDFPTLSGRAINPLESSYSLHMSSTQSFSSAWPLFSIAGIRVYMHWSWVLVAIFQINRGSGNYPNIAWDIAEYLGLFVIVLMHEFGHALATRQTGGTADRILLWPFGGIAFVQTPQRAGAYLWAIAAGPLVNVVLWPVLFALHTVIGITSPLGVFIQHLLWLNGVLLIFNLIPAYPLDGGQLLRGLLWIKLGPTKSLWIAAWIGLVLGVALIALALIWLHSLWIALLVGLMTLQSWSTIQQLRAFRRENGGRF